MITLLALSLLAPGCATIGTFQRAETMGKGNLEWGIEPVVWGIAANETSLMVPQLSGAIRYGVAEGIDIGAHVGSSGAQLDVKAALTPRDAPIRVSIAPSFGGFAIGAGSESAGIYFGQLPVLIGVPTGPRSELVLAPKLHIWGGGASSAGSASDAFLVSGGASVGYVAPVGERLSLAPELALVIPIAGGAGGVTDVVGDDAGAIIFQVGLGFLFGKSSGSGDR